MEQNTTCQICARNIKAKTGVIAHHGYERPGDGWQTASCMGARHLPYEQSRDLIPQVIEAYKGYRQNNIDREKELIKNPPATFTRIARYSFQEDKTFTRPADFNVKEALKAASYKAGDNDDGYRMEFYDSVRQCRNNIKDITAELDRLQRRYDEWVPPKQ